MKTHEEFKNIIDLWLIDELNESEKNSLTNHVNNCAECKELFLSNEKLFGAVNILKANKVSEELVTSARMEFRSLLRHERNKRNILKDIFEKIKSALFARPMQLAYTFGILAVGFIIGIMVQGPSQNVFQNYSSEDFISELFKENVAFQNINILSKNDNTDEYEFQFDAVKRITLSGEKNEEMIQKLLIYSIQNESNPGTRLNSINLIREKNNLTVDDEIKAVLIATVKSDSNSGVRREALKLLSEIPFDEDLKSAFLYVLTHDDNSGLRIDAMRSLANAYKAGKIKDEKFKENLNEKIQSEENSYIKILATSL